MTQEQEDDAASKIATNFCNEKEIRDLCRLWAAQTYPHADRYGLDEMGASMLSTIHGLVQEHALAMLPASASSWRSMESAPKDGTWIIGIEGDEVFRCRWSRWTEYDDEGFRTDNGWLFVPEFWTNEPSRTAAPLTVLDHITLADALLHDAEGEHASLAHGLVRQAAALMSEDADLREQAKAEMQPVRWEYLSSNSAYWNVFTSEEHAVSLAKSNKGIARPLYTTFVPAESVPAQDDLKGCYWCGAFVPLVTGVCDDCRIVGCVRRCDHNGGSRPCEKCRHYTLEGQWVGDSKSPPVPAHDEVSEAEIVAAAGAMIVRAGQSWECLARAALEAFLAARSKREVKK